MVAVDPSPLVEKNVSRKPKAKAKGALKRYASLEGVDKATEKFGFRRLASIEGTCCIVDADAEILVTSDESQAKSGLTKREAIMNFGISAVGAGCIMFPRAMANQGCVMALLIICGVASAACECGVLIINCCSLAELNKGLPVGSLKSYEDIAEAAMGPQGKRALMFLKNTYFLGIIVVYTCLETDGLQVWLPLAPEFIRWVIIAPIFVSLAMLRDLKAVAKLGSIGVLAAFLQASGVWLGAGYHKLMGPGGQEYMAVNSSATLTEIGAQFGTFFFGYGCISTLPTLRASMSDPTEITSAMRVGFVLVTFVYTSIMIIAYAGYGQAINDNAILSIEAPGCALFQFVMGSMSYGGLMFNLIISMPTFAYCVISVIEASGDDAWRTTFTPANLLMRAALILSVVFVSSQLPFAAQVVGVISPAFGSCLIIFLPITFFYRLKKVALSDDNLSDPNVSIKAKQILSSFGSARFALHMFIALLGFCVLFFGVQGGYNNLQAKLHGN